MAKSVRLKAYNPRAGFVLRRYTYRGIKFEEGKGWYKVPDDVAAYLETVRSVEHDEHAPLAFDVVTLAEASKITEAEYRKKVAAGRVAPGDAPVMIPRDTSDQVRGRESKVDPDYPETDLNAQPDLVTSDLARGTSRAAAPKTKRAAASRPKASVPPPRAPREPKEVPERSTRPG